MTPRPAWTLAVIAALAYPLGVVARGLPHFPARSECARPAKAGAKIDAVFGRFPQHVAADVALKRVVRSGFGAARIEPDACGHLEVTVQGIPSLAVGTQLVAEAHGAGLHVTLEQAAP